MRFGPTRSLSAKLLLLTVLFVMLAEVLIFIPSIARFRVSWLEEKLGAAHLAILALDATPDGMVSQDLEMELLRHVGAYSIAVRRVGAKLAIINDMPPKIDATVRIDRESVPMMMTEAFMNLFRTENRIIRLVAPSPKDRRAEIDMVLDEQPLCMAVRDYALRIAGLSIVISIMTAGLVFFALRWLLILPMRRITASISRFREAPDDRSRIISPSERADEVGIAERELAEMQDAVRQALRQKENLAALGTAVAKINHDLRGALSTALILSDRLETSADPEVRRVAPRVLDAIERAVRMCGQTLDYVGHDKPQLHPENIRLAKIVDEVGETISGGVAISCNIGDNIQISADRDQIFRVLSNIMNNAAQAGADEIRFTSRRENGFVTIDIADDGPGLSPRARANLFKPFQGSGRAGGTGLGLAIASDLVRAHGGELAMVSTGKDGTVFRISLPVEAD